MHFVTLYVNFHAAGAEVEVFQRLGPVGIAGNEFAIDPNSGGEDVRFLGEVADGAANEVCGAIRGDIDVFLGDGIFDFLTCGDGDEANFEVGLDGLESAGNDPSFPFGKFGLAGVGDRPVVVGTTDTDSDGGEDAGHGIVGWLPAEVVITDSPAGCGPAVVELPDKSTPAVSGISPLFTPASIAEHKGLGLDELGQVNVGFEIGVLGPDVLD